MKVIGDEEYVTKHKLLACKTNLRTQIRKLHNPPPKRHIWQLQKPEIQGKYKKALEESLYSTTLISDPDTEADVESILTEIKFYLINAGDSACGWMKGNGKQERETWWWDETVESLVKHKRKLWKG